MKRLDPPLLNGLRTRFERRLLALSVLIGSAVWPAALAGKFRRLVPGGRIFFPSGPRSADASGGFSKSERREVLSAALAYAAVLTPSTRPFRSSVTAFIDRGEILMIFVPGSNTPAACCDRWNRIIRRANLVSAFLSKLNPFDSPG